MLPAAELARTFNCGIGMVAIVGPDRRDEALELLDGTGARPIGSVVKAAGENRVEIANTDSAWPS
jgi:phosphoribosylformylglycinamidine cyclo-ligase